MTKYRFSLEFIEKSIRPIKWLGNKSGGAVAVSTDSRTIKAGELFVALVGPNFDGHDYLQSVVDSGATALIVSSEDSAEKLLENNSQLAVFLVEDTLQALGDLAHGWRMKQNPQVFAITGSNGKTTTKELLASILSEVDDVLKTEGNLNNLIGLPQTILKLEEQALLVVEMGMSELGEIDRLTEIATPDIGIISNVNPAHLETLGSLENIARAKGELFKRLSGDNWAIVNLDNSYTEQLGKACKAKKITVSLIDPSADVYARNIIPNPQGFKVEVVCNGQPVEVVLPLMGRHNISNMLAAMAAASVAGVSPDTMAKGIEKCVVPGRRLKVRKDLTGFTLIDDCYNANPSSMAVALELLSDIAGAKRKFAILGDMLELGEGAEIYHKQVGSRAAECGTTKLCAFGSFAENIIQGAVEGGMKAENCFATEDFEQLEQFLWSKLKSGDVVLVKGSRGMRLERAVNSIEKFAKE